MKFDDKRIGSQLSKDALYAADKFEEDIHSLMDSLHNIAEKLSFELDVPVSYKLFEDVSAIIKLFDFVIDTDNLSFPEKISLYTKASCDFLKKRLIIIPGLKGLLSPEEYQLFLQDICNSKIPLLILENKQYAWASSYENEIVVDEDLCII